MMLRCPRGVSLQSSSEKSKIADFCFPVMVKSLQASGSYSAHDMAVVWSAEDVDRFTYPLYVQEYINHDGTIFKVYVLGEHNFIVTRVSLPNFPLDYQQPVRFNSQDWKHELPPELTKEYTGKRKEPEMELIQTVSAEVSHLLGLSLFGFDVIENIDTGKLAIIDVNYFPGAWFSKWMQPREHTTTLRPTTDLLPASLPALSPSDTDYRGVSDIFGKLLNLLIQKRRAGSYPHRKI